MASDQWKIVKYTNVLPTNLIVLLDKALTSLSNVVNALTKIIKLLQMFISAFNSFSIILKTFIDYAQNQIKQFTSDLGALGVYFNVLIPPAFLKSLMDNGSFSDLSSGGFDGFLQRLKVSLNNTADKNAPKFSNKAIVGGFVILLDSETLYDFYKGLDFITSTFSFMDVFPLNTSPMPPRNVKAVSGNYKQPDGTLKPGIQLSWEAPNVRGFTHYRLSRSRVSGGNRKESKPIPTKLVGPPSHPEQGLIQAAMIRLFGGDGEWPSVVTYEYNDPTFNGGKPVIVAANPVNSGGAYMDYDVTETDKQFYYVVESGFNVGVGVWGLRCPEVSVPVFVRDCISNNQAAVVVHAGNKLEFISVGYEGLGQWSAIQLKGVVPFLPAVIDLLNKFVTALAGALKTNTKSFVDFINGIKQSFLKYKAYLETIATMIMAIENFFSGMPKICFLNVLPESGGMDNFYRRVANAKKPSGGFSSKTGFTMGVVFVYGEGLNANFIGEGTPDFKAQMGAINKSFGLIIKLLS